MKKYILFDIDDCMIGSEKIAKNTWLKAFESSFISNDSNFIISQIKNNLSFIKNDDLKNRFKDFLIACDNIKNNEFDKLLSLIFDCFLLGSTQDFEMIFCNCLIDMNIIIEEKKENFNAIKIEEDIPANIEKSADVSINMLNLLNDLIKNKHKFFFVSSSNEIRVKHSIRRISQKYLENFNKQLNSEDFFVFHSTEKCKNENWFDIKKNISFKEDSLIYLFEDNKKNLTAFANSFSSSISILTKEFKVDDEDYLININIVKNSLTENNFNIKINRNYKENDNFFLYNNIIDCDIIEISKKCSIKKIV